MAELYLVSALGCALAWDWPSLVIFRFVGGLGIGGSSVLGPMYIAEIVVFGILAAYFSNYPTGLAHVGAAEWRWQLGTAAIPSAFFLLMLFTVPRSPRWLQESPRSGGSSCTRMDW